jgi:hypothetical protein
LTRIASRVVAVALAASVVTLLRCEAIVGDTVPGFTCEGTSLAACPKGQYCNGSGCKACEPQDVCDHYDNDCNGVVDDGPLSDADKDGFSWCGKIDAQGHPYDVDCDDTDNTVYPGAPEICDGKDNNCDGLVDNGATCDNGQSCFNGKCVNACDVDAGNSCGPSKHCDSVTHTCVNDTVVGIGQPCTADSECQSPLFCVDASVVGSNVLPSGANGMCTQPCCSSADCPASFVCYAPGAGGRYCVDPTKIGRSSTLGPDPPGTSDSDAGRCRSGELVNGRCADTCCSDSDCSNGTACAYGKLDGHDGTVCTPGTGSGRQGDICFGSSDCRALVCAGGSLYGTCYEGCCGSAKCGAADGSICAYAVYGQSTDIVALCWQSPMGSKVTGATCAANGDCVSGTCYDDIAKGEHYCTDACCVDSDCGSGFVCRPTPTLPHCVKP